MSQQLSIKAPLSGVLVPLDTVPDPVFSQKMVGDGIAIDPTSEVLLAPCAGTVVQMHPAGHAVTVRSSEGLEILVHIGIDTVKLKGEGFEPLVQVGQTIYNQSGKSLEVFAIWMGFYLACSLAISVVVNFFNVRLKIVER